jgi:hypothetical protein
MSVQKRQLWPLSTRPADHLVVRIPVVDQGCQIKVSQLIVQTVSVVIGMNANVWAFSKQTFSPDGGYTIWANSILE